MPKVCTKCKNEKPLTEYYNRKKAIDGKRGECRSCSAYASRSWQQANPEKARETRRKAQRALLSRNPQYQANAARKHLYGITSEQFTELLILQDHGCAICAKSATIQGKALAVDHCHDTGKIRGLLCDVCNRAIGLFKNNAAYLQSAVKYLTKETPNETV